MIKKESLAIVVIFGILLSFWFITYNNNPFEDEKYRERHVAALNSSPSISETTALVFAADYYRGRVETTDNNQIFTVEKRDEIISSLFIQPMLEIQAIIIDENNNIEITENVQSIQIAKVYDRLVEEESKENVFIVNIQEGFNDDFSFNMYSFIIDAETKDLIGYTEFNDKSSQLLATEWLSKDENHKDFAIKSSVIAQNASIYSITSNSKMYFLGKATKNETSAFVFFNEKYKDIIIQLNPIFDIE